MADDPILLAQARSENPQGDKISVLLVRDGEYIMTRIERNSLLVEQYRRGGNTGVPRFRLQRIAQMRAEKEALKPPKLNIEGNPWQT